MDADFHTAHKPLRRSALSGFDEVVIGAILINISSNDGIAPIGINGCHQACGALVPPVIQHLARLLTKFGLQVRCHLTEDRQSQVGDVNVVPWRGHSDGNLIPHPGKIFRVGRRGSRRIGHHRVLVIGLRMK